MERKITKRSSTLQMSNSFRTMDEETKAAASIYRKIANTCLPDSIKMKEDTTAYHPNGRIPILDTEMWMEGGQIKHSHYQKLMTSMKVLLARSAMSLASKMDTLV